MSPAIGEKLIQRKYMVRVGFPVTGDLAALDKVIEIDYRGDLLHVLPVEEFPITLTYTKDKMRNHRELHDYTSPDAVAEACERAVTVWRNRHPDSDEDYALIFGFDARPLWERELVNKLSP